MGPKPCIIYGFQFDLDFSLQFKVYLHPLNPNFVVKEDKPPSNGTHVINSNVGMDHFAYVLCRSIVL